ncbi:MAG: hypothetical protein SF029_21830 [bacterium]|nr:hypothetical protein [bacterium]
MQTAPCEYRLLENGIHLFILNHSTRAASEFLLDQFYQVVLATSPDVLIRYIVDVHGVNNSPIRQTLERAQALNRQMTERAVTRGAYLHSNRAMAIIAEGLIRLIIHGSNDRLKFFHVSEFVQAVAWVLAE